MRICCMVIVSCLVIIASIGATSAPKDVMKQLIESSALPWAIPRENRPIDPAELVAGKIVVEDPSNAFHVDNDEVTLAKAGSGNPYLWDKQKDPSAFLPKEYAKATVAEVLIPDTQFRLLLLDGKPAPILWNSRSGNLWRIEGLENEFKNMRFVELRSRCVALQTGQVDGNGSRCTLLFPEQGNRLRIRLDSWTTR